MAQHPPFQEHLCGKPLVTSERRPRRTRAAAFLLAAVSIAMISTGFAAPLVSGSGQGGGCKEGWQWVNEIDDSFLWQETSIPFRSASWSGTVRLLENLDANCYVLGIILAYTGNNGGGHLVVNGNLFISYTIQSASFDDYANVAMNDIGVLTMWNPPAGSYPPELPAYTVDPHFDINAAGADEYFIQGLGLPGNADGVYAVFEIPTAYLGQTVYAQVHVGYNLCQCSVTPIFLQGESPPPGSVPWDVYVHAHQDDWQLFESPSSYHDYQGGDNLIFITVSAGDAGQGPSYWGTREAAQEESVKVIAGPDGGGFGATVSICYTDTTEVCHNIWQWTYGRTISFFMRLPDGGLFGGGFASTNYATLEKLRDGQISSLSSVDGSTTYNSWQDLYLTVKAIISTHAPYDSTTTINAPDFDRDRQTAQGDVCPGCGDHADHLAVGDLMYAITIGENAPWTRAWHIDYPIGFGDPRYPENLGTDDYNIKKELFMAYSDYVKNAGGQDEYATMPWFWENCFKRDYSRSA